VASMGGKLLVDQFAAALIFLAKESESLNQRRFCVESRRHMIFLVIYVHAFVYKMSKIVG